MIRVENLVKKFGDVTAVDHISLQVSAGEIFAFLGPNGAGKTTTIKMLTTLLEPTSGTLEVDGLDPRRHSHEVRKRFGIVFQDSSLDGDMTAGENMELHGVFYHLPRKIRLQRTETLLRLFELWDRRNDRVKLFSGGMKRRLEIARGLLHTRIQIMLGRTLGAATVAVIQGLLVVIVCFIAGFRVVNLATAPLALVFMLLIACLFASLGTAIGSTLQNMQGFQLIMNFLVMPIFFLSGALYPLNNLPKVFSFVTSLDPLAYGVDAMRTILVGLSHFGLRIDTAVLVTLTVILLLIGSYLFSKIEA